MATIYNQSIKFFLPEYNLEIRDDLASKIDYVALSAVTLVASLYFTATLPLETTSDMLKMALSVGAGVQSFSLAQRTMWPLFGFPSRTQRPETQFKNGDLNKKISIIFKGVILGPILEEFLFRSVLYTLGGCILSPIVNILFNAALFSALHYYNDPENWSVWILTGTLLLGVNCSIVRYRTGSVLASIVSHIASNAIFVGIILFNHKDE